MVGKDKPPFAVGKKEVQPFISVSLWIAKGLIVERGNKLGFIFVPLPGSHVNIKAFRALKTGG